MDYYLYPVCKISIEYSARLETNHLICSWQLSQKITDLSSLLPLLIELGILVRIYDTIAWIQLAVAT